MEMRKQGENVPKIIKAEWIFRCLREGNMENESDYLFRQ